MFRSTQTSVVRAALLAAAIGMFASQSALAAQTQTASRAGEQSEAGVSALYASHAAEQSSIGVGTQYASRAGDRYDGANADA